MQEILATVALVCRWPQKKEGLENESLHTLSDHLSLYRQMSNENERPVSDSNSSCPDYIGVPGCCMIMG